MTARNALSLALIGAGSMALALPLSSQAAGFVEDAKVTLGLRNFYINRNFVDPAFSQGKAEEWTQSFILDARSGFSQGTRGFRPGRAGHERIQARRRQGHAQHRFVAGA
nr:OprD family outer membrane porin [uncultured Pseudomonas sp.]